MATAATAVTVPEGKLTTSAKVRPTTGFTTQSHTVTASTGPTRRARARGRLRRIVARNPAAAAVTTTNGRPQPGDDEQEARVVHGRMAANAQRSNSVGPGRTVK